MNNKKMVGIIAVIFVLLIGGASVLYNRLSKTVEHSGLVVEESTQETVTEQESPEAESEQEAQDTAAEAESSVSATADDGDEAEEKKISVPDFTVTDQDGNSVSLSDFVGKPVILNFWASWCGPCKSEMPDFDAAYAQYGDEIHFVMVNLTDGYRETPEVAQKFIEEQGYSFPVYFDTESSAAMAYRVTSIPATYFIDAKGDPVAQGRGALDADTLQKGIDMLSSQ